MGKELKKCTQCDHQLWYEPSDVWWVENGSGYSTKLVRCPNCGRINILRYAYDIHFKTCVNEDERYYL